VPVPRPHVGRITIPSGLIAVVGWLWPGAILFLTGVWFATTWGDAAWFSQAVLLYAPLIFGIGLFLAWRFDRSRVSAVLVGLALLNYLPGWGSGEASAQSHRRARAIGAAHGLSSWPSIQDRVAPASWS